jgi:hypothetical protein
MLNDAIRLATTEHVIYFLLTAYVETLDYYDPPRSSIPARAKRLPMAGKADVLERLHALLDARKAQTRSGSIERVVIEEAVDVFSAALQQLTALQTSDAT